MSTMSKKDPQQESSYLAEECDKVGEIAIQYGFTAVLAPHISSADQDEAKQLKEYDYYADAEEKTSLIRWYIQHNLVQGSQPTMIFYRRPLPGGTTRKKPTEESYGLEIIGSSRAEGEALIIKTTLAILHDLGYKNLCVHINSMGDKESVSRFDREFGAYCRKHIHDLPAKLRDAFKKNHYSVLFDTTTETEEFRHNAPQTVGTLSDPSRCHFMEVLEYLESFGVTYKIVPNLLSNKLYASHTVFEVHEARDPSKDEDGARLAYGYRYNHMAKRLGAKREIPSIGMTITVKKDRVPQKKIMVKNIRKPRFYLVQLGGTAKLKALNVVEMLRSERIPVYHSFTKDKITGQLSGAEYVKATHVLIIGQKEAIEESIVVRHVVTREQETVSLRTLADFLKRIGS